VLVVQLGTRRVLPGENQEGVRVSARTWAEIIDKADYRLNFITDKLGYAPSDGVALDYLRQTHAAYVPETLRADDANVAP
jgi:hypothetical protein